MWGRPREHLHMRPLHLAQGHRVSSMNRARPKEPADTGPGRAEPRLLRKGWGPAPETVPGIVSDVLADPGTPLHPGVRRTMEERFGHDFSSVRVHTDPRAAQSAQAVNARAYTVGRDVVFGAGQ